jgi:ankyrin repeat protein
LQIIEELLSAGADPNTADFSGNHLIHSAVWLQRSFLGSSYPIHALTAATKFGNDVTAVNNLGQTALHLAMTKRLDSRMEAKSVDIQRLDFLLGTKLIDSLSAKDHNGLTPAHLAAASSETLLSRLIYAGADIQATDFRARLPLHLAAANLSNTTGLLCQIYGKNSWDVDQADLQGRTPLHEAASAGNFEAVKFLLKSGANPSKTDKLNRSPLHAAVTFIRARRIARLERDFYSRDRQQRTSSQNPLYLGSSTKLQRPLGLWLEDELDQRNAQDVVHALLEAGSDACLVDYLGYTAYDLALVNDNENVAHLLLNPRGALRATELTGPIRLPTDLARQWLSPDARIITEIVKSMPLGKIVQYEYVETAVYLGDTLLLETLLRSGIDLSVSSMANAGFTIVHACVCAGQISMMKTLAPYIEDINSFSPPLLHLAVEREGSNLEMIKLLLELGANPNIMFPSHVPTRQEKQNYDNVFRNGKFPSIENCHTVLHRLAAGWCWWHNEAIDLIVAKSADVEATNSDGMSALHLTLSGKNHGFWRNQCLDVLLSCGADVNKVHEKSGLTSLNMALEGNCGMEIVQKLIKHGADIGTGPNPPLISAIGGVDLPGVKLLLDAGADPNGTYGTEKRLPLQIAADAWTENEGYLDGLPDIITLLLEAGSDPFAEVTAHWFDTTRMFHYFCYKNAPIQPFIDFGVDIETRDQSGRTGLHTACLYFGYIDQGGMPSWVANELIASDAELDVTDTSGNTPLICTMQTDSDLWEVFNSLVENGASVTIQNLEGRTVLNYALEHNEYEIHQKVYLVRSLMEKGADPKVGLNDAGATNLHTIASMLASCVPYEGDEDTGNYGDIEQFYQQFLELGCDPEAQDDNGNTPAFYYVKTSELSDTYNQKSEPLSLAHWKTYLEKVDVKAVNQDGDNLLHVVADRQERRNVDNGADVERLFKLLMDLGADPKAENKAGVSPLDIAATCGKTGILEMFKRETL